MLLVRMASMRPFMLGANRPRGWDAWAVRSSREYVIVASAWPQQPYQGTQPLAGA